MVEEDWGGGPEGMNEAVVSDEIICHSKWMTSEQLNIPSGSENWSERAGVKMTAAGGTNENQCIHLTKAW